MNQYYSSLLSDIVRLMAAGDFEKAEALIEPELALPYVPEEARVILEEYQTECGSHTAERKSAGRADIEAMVSGSTSQKEMAASILQGMNLRQYQPEVQTLLNAADLIREFKGELIEALMEQRVDADFTLREPDEMYRFNPCGIVPRDSDPVYLETRKLLEDWLSSDNPVMADFCIQMLDQEVLECRPADLAEYEPRKLAAALCRLVFDAMHDDQGWQNLKETQNLREEESADLRIQKRGE